MFFKNLLLNAMVTKSKVGSLINKKMVSEPFSSIKYISPTVPMRFFASNPNRLLNGFSLDTIQNSHFEVTSPLFVEKNDSIVFNSLWDIQKFLSEHSEKDKKEFLDACIVLKRKVENKLEPMIQSVSQGVSWSSAGATEDAWDSLTDLLKQIKPRDYKLLFCQVFEKPLKNIIKNLLGGIPYPITTHNREASHILMEAFPEISQACLREHPNKLRYLLSHVNNMETDIRQPALNKIVEFLLEENTPEGILNRLENIKYQYNKEAVNEMEASVKNLLEECYMPLVRNKI